MVAGNSGRISLKYTRERYFISGGREIHAFAFTRIISADYRNKWAVPVGPTYAIRGSIYGVPGRLIAMWATSL